MTNAGQGQGWRANAINGVLASRVGNPYFENSYLHVLYALPRDLAHLIALCAAFVGLNATTNPNVCDQSQ